MPRPVIDPMPVVATGTGLSWDVPTDDPVVALAHARASCGDTFVVDSGPDRYIFTFSPVGVASFYGLAESSASKGVADWRMLRRKIPDEVFDGRRTVPHELFGREERIAQLAGLQAALAATVSELGDRGGVDVFALSRRLGHRVGLASWGGPGTADGADFDRLVAAFDSLDGAEAFVHPEAMAAVAESGKAVERAALSEVVEVVGAAAERPCVSDEHPLFIQIRDRWADEEPATRRVGIAYDVALVHIASMSNLFAALGWALIDLLAHPAERDRVVSGDVARTEQCVLESIRLAQRSIMARYVLEAVDLNVGDAVLTVSPGVTIATLLPLTNTTAGPGLDSWNPDRWHRRRLVDAQSWPAAELVTAFGHGKHKCPAQPYSLAALTAILTCLLTTFDFDLDPADIPGPEPAQIGGVARPAGPCKVTYRRAANVG
jgi:cytochrome P450